MTEENVWCVAKYVPVIVSIFMKVLSHANPATNWTTREICSGHEHRDHAQSMQLQPLRLAKSDRSIIRMVVEINR